MIETTERELGCWVLVNAAGEFYDNGSSIPHWGSAEDAAADEMEVPEADGYTPQRLGKVCVTLKCVCCGDFLVTDDDTTEHHESAEAAWAMAKECGWSTRKDGTDVCEECKTHDWDCLLLPDVPAVAASAVPLPLGEEQ